MSVERLEVILQVEIRRPNDREPGEMFRSSPREVQVPSEWITPEVPREQIFSVGLRFGLRSGLPHVRFKVLLRFGAWQVVLVALGILRASCRRGIHRGLFVVWVSWLVVAEEIKPRKPCGSKQ